MYRQRCYRFTRLFGLPESYLDMDQSHCCCDPCLASSKMVDPSLKGWCRFAVQSKRVNVHSEAGINEKWQLAYHGTRPAIVRRILDEGHLLPPDLAVWQRSRAARSSKGHDGDSEGCSLLFSPILKPAASFAPAARLYDPTSKDEISGQIVLQVVVQPGSYKVKRASSPLGTTTSSTPAVAVATSVVSPSGSSTQQLMLANTDDAIYWYTKERGAAIVQALLVRMD